MSPVPPCCPAGDVHPAELTGVWSLDHTGTGRYTGRFQRREVVLMYKNCNDLFKGGRREQPDGLFAKTRSQLNFDRALL